MKTRLLSCVLKMALLSLPLIAFGQTVDGIHVATPSTWKFDPAQSDMGVFGSPKSDEITFLKDQPDLLTFKERIEWQGMKPLEYSWSGKPDGTQQPLEGSGGDTLSFSPDFRTARVVMHDGTTGDYTQSFSTDHKTFTQLLEITQKSGKKVHLKLVYVRVN